MKYSPCMIHHRLTVQDFSHKIRLICCQCAGPYPISVFPNRPVFVMDSFSLENLSLYPVRVSGRYEVMQFMWRFRRISEESPRPGGPPVLQSVETSKQQRLSVGVVRVGYLKCSPLELPVWLLSVLSSRDPLAVLHCCICQEARPWPWSTMLRTWTLPSSCWTCGYSAEADPENRPVHDGCDSRFPFSLILLTAGHFQGQLKKKQKMTNLNRRKRCNLDFVKSWRWPEMDPVVRVCAKHVAVLVLRSDSSTCSRNGRADYVYRGQRAFIYPVQLAPVILYLCCILGEGGNSTTWGQWPNNSCFYNCSPGYGTCLLQYQVNSLGSSSIQPLLPPGRW